MRTTLLPDALHARACMDTGVVCIGSPSLATPCIPVRMCLSCSSGSKAAYTMCWHGLQDVLCVTIWWYGVCMHAVWCPVQMRAKCMLCTCVAPRTYYQSAVQAAVAAAGGKPTGAGKKSDALANMAYSARVQERWVIDSGATRTICNNRAAFDAYHPAPGVAVHPGSPWTP